MKKPPKKVFVIIDGDNGTVLETHFSKKKAAKELKAYNSLKGYKPNCFMLKYKR